MPDLSEIKDLYDRPLFELLRRSHEQLCKYFSPGEIQTSRLLSVKTGGCPEDCAYCPQSAHYQTGVEKEKLLSLSEVKAAAEKAKSEGATRFCMGAAWRQVRDGDEFDRVLDMVETVKDLGLQTCCTLGMISAKQAQRLKKAGLHAYNHNLDTSSDHYKKIISTRDYEDRLNTLAHVRKAGITVCTGGILGMGESDEDRITFLRTLASLKPHPESITINKLVPIPGTPLGGQAPLSNIVVIRVISVARILMPRAVIRLSAGRLSMTPTEQFIAFYAGANSIFMGEKLLTSPNPGSEEDKDLFEELGLVAKKMN
ncbi:MAG: biotin synthase BioB [Cytophagales bacterium]|nr:biotin synthase BioB [Cytophagales bacterium]